MRHEPRLGRGFQCPLLPQETNATVSPLHQAKSVRILTRRCQAQGLRPLLQRRGGGPRYGRLDPSIPATKVEMAAGPPGTCAKSASGPLVPPSPVAEHPRGGGSHSMPRGARLMAAAGWDTLTRFNQARLSLPERRTPHTSFGRQGETRQSRSSQLRRTW